MNAENKSNITVLGKRFNSDEERRKYFREALRKKLPELKNIEGFPIGEDEDIIALSDPPYYTACPNPWLNDFISEWESEKKELENQNIRNAKLEVKEPYAADVSEGKNNPIYNAHSYHTKVPHPAIMRYILHYTDPGDIVFDGFSGTGMTGVAAAMCQTPEPDFKHLIEKDNKNVKWGRRRSICGDLSTIASFIANGYNSVIDNELFVDLSQKGITEVEKKYGWFYDTMVNHGLKAKINYTLWSQVQECKSCGHHQPLWEPDESFSNFSMADDFVCKKCHVSGSEKFSPVFSTYFDPIIGEPWRKREYVPVLINFIYNGKRGYKRPDQFDLDLISKTTELLKEYTKVTPNFKIEKGDKTNELLRDNYHFVHQLFTPRNLISMMGLWDKLDFDRGKLIVTSTLTKTSSILHNVGFKDGKINLAGALPNALYVPGLYAERNIFELHRSKMKDLSFNGVKSRGVVQVSSATFLANINSESIDYIFTDPPFGGNLMYSELNSIHEGWLKVKTNSGDEAIINRNQKKGHYEYRDLMTKSFTEFYRILKPNKWMTVEFSNTKADIWNIIQTALIRSNFVIASVDSLDKGQGTFNSQTNPTSVKQDLIISCYKPSSEFDKKFKENKNPNIAVWDFVIEHLNHLPIHLVKENSTTAIIERSPKILYDRLIAFYIQRGLHVPIDASKFQQGLRERFIERDGMFFTNTQVQEYDTKKATVPNFAQLSFFVANEQDSIYWLRDILKKGRKTESDLHPFWMKEVAGNMRKGDALPEMRTILEENFLKDNHGKWYVPDSENEADLEKLRTKRLIKQFDAYKVDAAKPKAKIKEVRVEALRAGFKQCYQDKDFKTIVTVGDKIPNNLLMEDEVLLQFYDIASSRV